MDFLQKILKLKKIDIEKDKNKLPLTKLKKLVTGYDIKNIFYKSLLNSYKNNSLAVIGEIKKASPSKGIISKNFQSQKFAKIYEETGITAISVLTEKNYFLGSWDIFKKVRKATKLPLLCKDFIIDEYQIYQAVYYGASAVLLIASILTLNELQRFYNLTSKLGIDVLIEVHNKQELNKVLKLNPKIIGINNRNLNTFKVDLKTTLHLKKFIPENIFVISESGIKTAKDIELFKKNKIPGVLIGESFMRGADLKENISLILK